MQNSSTRFIKSCELAVRTSNITKLRTCGCGLEILRSCGLQILRSCGLTVADFKNYEVTDLRLRIQESGNVVADLRTKLLSVQLRTCGCGLRKMKFGCGFADCGLKKKLAVPSTDDYSRFSILAQGRLAFYLSALEATFIKTSNPAFCRQKELLYNLKIPITTFYHWSFSSQSRLGFFLYIHVCIAYCKCRKFMFST